MAEIEDLLIQAGGLSYPSSMKPTRQKIDGRAFFPGGSGVLDNSMVVSDKPIMVLGQDFDTEANYEKSLENKGENNPTWTNMCELFRQVGLDENSCFFTNAIMGVRVATEGTTKNRNTGESPAFRDPKFVKQCQDFFLHQLTVQKPKLVMVLGKIPAHFLASLATELNVWKKGTSIKSIDEAGHQIIEDVVFPIGVNTTLVLLAHPSYRHANAKNRRYNGKDDAEISMLRDALQKAGLRNHH